MVRRLRGATRCGSGLPGSGPSLECTLISVHEGRLWAWKRWSWAWACFVAVVVVRKDAWRFCVCSQKTVRRAVGIPTWKQKSRRGKMPDHGDPWFSRSACGTAVPAKWIALDMKRITFMGWADWCCGPGCVYGPPAYAYVMCGLVVTFSTKSGTLVTLSPWPEDDAGLP